MVELPDTHGVGEFFVGVPFALRVTVLHVRMCDTQLLQKERNL